MQFNNNQYNSRINKASNNKKIKSTNTIYRGLVKHVPMFSPQVITLRIQLILSLIPKINKLHISQCLFFLRSTNYTSLETSSIQVCCTLFNLRSIKGHPSRCLFYKVISYIFASHHFSTHRSFTLFLQSPSKRRRRKFNTFCSRKEEDEAF